MKNFALISRARRGFTLVEMLVVIAVISLLAAISFPVFSRVREGGRKTTCISNLRQLGLAFRQYIQDSGRYPLPGNHQRWNDGGDWIRGGRNGIPENLPTATKGLAEITAPYAYVENHQAFPELGALYPYVKSKEVYICPSAPDKDQKKLSYSMNCALPLMADTRIRTPHEIVLLVDEGETINDGYFWATDNAAGTDSLMKKHNGGGNILFVDGRVKFFTFKSLTLDESVEGRANKTSQTNPVRFLDRAFGPKGANLTPIIPPATASVKDFCGADIP